MNPAREQHVLVADDESALREMLRRSLAAKNCRVSGAGDGEEALRLAREQRPELILLDISMPGLDGTGVLKELRRAPQTRAIPVMMLTGRGAVEEKVRAFELGADDYVTKPFDMKELSARIEWHLGRGRAAPSSDLLTRLPGSSAIEAEVKRRLESGDPFAFLKADIDGLGGFNEACGYELGDELLLATAGALLAALGAQGGPDDFAGHTGGDDFYAVTAPALAENVARAAADGFDRAAARLFLLGAAGQAPMPSLSIGVAGASGGKIDHYAAAMETAAELVAFLKESPGRSGSAWLLDRRGRGAKGGGKDE